MMYLSFNGLFGPKRMLKVVNKKIKKIQKTLMEGKIGTTSK
jgi:hypothetical protein